MAYAFGALGAVAFVAILVSFACEYAKSDETPDRPHQQIGHHRDHPVWIVPVQAPLARESEQALIGERSNCASNILSSETHIARTLVALAQHTSARVSKSRAPLLINDLGR